MMAYFRKACQSQKINPNYLNLKFIFGIIQIITTACQICLITLFNAKKYTYIYTISITDL